MTWIDHEQLETDLKLVVEKLLTPDYVADQLSLISTRD